MKKVLVKPNLLYLSLLKFFKVYWEKLKYKLKPSYIFSPEFIKKNWKQILISIVVIYFLYLIIDIFTMKEYEITKSKGEPNLEIVGTKFVKRKEGKINWEFMANKVFVDTDERKVKVPVINGALLYKDNKPYLKISARAINLKLDQDNFEATGGVEGEVLGTGIRFKVGKLFWDPYQSIIRGEDGVEIYYRDEGVLRGKDFIYNTRFDTFQLDKGVEIEIRSGVK